MRHLDYDIVNQLVFRNRYICIDIDIDRYNYTKNSIAFYKISHRNISCKI